MRPDVVVVASPLLDADLGLHAVSEPLQAQKFVAEFPVGLEFRIRSLNRGLGHHCVAPEF